MGAVALALTSSIAHSQAGAQHDVAVAPPPGTSGADAKFRFLFDPIAAWPNTMFWSYNASGAPSAFSNAAAVSSAMQQVIATWTSACNIHAAYAGATATAPEASVFDGENGPQPDGVNVLGWKPTPSSISGYTVAYPGFNDGGGGLSPIVDADVILDPSKVTNADFLQRLLLHEFGHALGINHAQFDNALMSGPPYSDYNTLAALTQDDIRACRCLYGAPPGVNGGLLCSTPPVLEFGTVAAGDTSQQSFQIANGGNAPVTIGSVTSSSAAYQVSGCSGSTLQPSANCVMQVAFSPTTAGDQGAAVSINVGEATPYRIKLVGAASGGVSTPLTPNPDAVDFGLVPISTSAQTQRVKLVNFGPTSVTISSMRFEGAQSDEFVRSGACRPGLVVAASGNCTADIGFKPASTGPRSAQFVVQTSDGRIGSMTVSGSGQSTVTTPEPGLATPVTVVEYYRSVSDHYFITIAPDEIAALDTGLFPGWTRTGLTFKAYAVSQPGYSPICRFYLPPPADSHFYSASPAECAQVQIQAPSFILESTAVMHLAVPNYISGVCPGGSVPIYRVWNHRADTNHRYTTNIQLRDQMVALGYIAEGSGPNAVTFCSPQ